MNTLLISLLFVPAQLPTGVELLDRCQAAYDAVRTLEVTSKTKQGSLTADAHLFFERPGKLRVSGKGLAAKYDLWITPTDRWLYHVGWMKQDSLEMAIGGVSGVSGQTATYLPPLLLHEKWGNLMSIKKYPLAVSSERLGDRDAYRLTATGPNTTMRVWFEKSTYFIARIAKDVPGGVQDISFGPYKVNKAIPAGTFSRPAGALD
jgi:hypothetical protein